LVFEAGCGRSRAQKRSSSTLRLEQRYHNYGERGGDLEETGISHYCYLITHVRASLGIRRRGAGNPPGAAGTSPEAAEKTQEDGRLPIHKQDEWQFFLSPYIVDYGNEWQRQHPEKNHDHRYSLVGRSQHPVYQFLGVRLGLWLSPKFLVSLKGDVGGFGLVGDDHIDCNMEALLGYRVSQHVYAYAGYRAHGAWYDFGQDLVQVKVAMWVHGPVLGMTYAF
jgi:hypothetical protein